jgi:hypothetical protein
LYVPAGSVTPVPQLSPPATGGGRLAGFEPLTCPNVGSRERSMKYGPAACAIDVSSYKKYPLTCAQALPGRGVTTLALAAQTMTALAVGSCSW